MLFKSIYNFLKKTNICKILFIFALIYFAILGLLLSYNFDFSHTFNLLFQADTGRVIQDMTNIFANHYRLKVHPLFVILTEPIFFLIKGFTLNKMIALVLMSSVASAFTVVFIYKILSLYSEDTKFKLIITLCYLFSFSNIIYTSSIEIYNFAALFLVILWYYVLKAVKDNNFTFYAFYIIIILGILAFGFTITNFFIFLIILFVLFIFKKVKLRNLIFICSLTMVLSITIVYFQNIIWHNTPIFFNFQEEASYTSQNFSFNNIANVLNGDYSNSIISNRITLQENNRVINFNFSSYLNIFLMIIFYTLLFLLVYRNLRYNKFANFGLLISLLYNSVLHSVYGNENTFLYSMHFLYLIILLFGINLGNEKNKTWKKYIFVFLTILLLYEIVINNYRFFSLINIVKNVVINNLLVQKIGFLATAILEVFVVLALAFLCYYIIKVYKMFKSIKQRDKKTLLAILIIILVLMMQCIFINLHYISDDNDSCNQSEIEYDFSAFENVYPEEIQKLKNYIQEYDSFLYNYRHETIDYLKNSNYFFFGMGNRKKLLFKENYLLNVDDATTIYSFNVESSLIIPNIYTVLIKTIDGQFIKIVEDKNGVHIISNKDKIIEGTDSYLDLYDFKNQKYANIKKVLYNEILFNIKDGKIYPNILVYDEPWYRDAAIASMVLKETNNTNLITNWVLNIDEIYDKQNNGIKECDNLGELLYIISTQNKQNNKLISKIEKEAQQLIQNNTSQNYLKGKTDFLELPLYQSLWYKMGLESLGKQYIYDLPEQPDYYSITAWWSKDTPKNNISLNYNANYPYLLYAAYHTSRNNTIPLNKNIYPLSWEKSASEANYNKMSILGNYYQEQHISPLHTWSAAELLLLLLDDTNDLQNIY